MRYKWESEGLKYSLWYRSKGSKVLKHVLGLQLCVLSTALYVTKLLYLFPPSTRKGTGRTIVPNLMNNGPKSARWRVVAKSRENMVLGSLEQAMPECFWNLSRFARSGLGGQNEAGRCRSPPPADHRSRCGLEGRLTHPDPTSRSPRQSGQANDAPIREPPI